MSPHLVYKVKSHYSIIHLIVDNLYNAHYLVPAVDNFYNSHYLCKGRYLYKGHKFKKKTWAKTYNIMCNNYSLPPANSSVPTSVFRD